MSHAPLNLIKRWSPTLLLSLALCQASCGTPDQAAQPSWDLLQSQPQALRLDKPEIIDVQGAVCPTRGGCEVTVVGRRFDPALSTLLIGGKPATPCRIATSSRMVCTVPPGSPGQVSLEVANSLGGVTKSHTWGEKFFLYLAKELPLWPLRTLALSAVPKATAVGDLNGDGHNDIAVIYHGRDGVQVFLGQPGGRSWAPPLDFATGRGPSAIAAADFDGDSSKTSDLIITNELDDSFTRLVGVKATPSAAYNPTISTISLLGSHPCVRPNQIVAQDLNQDGGTDLVINCIGGSPSMIAFTNSRKAWGALDHTDTAYTLNGTVHIAPVHANSDMISDMMIWRSQAGSRHPLTEHGRESYLLRYNNKSHYGIIALGTTPLSSIGSGRFDSDQMIDFMGLTDSKEIWVIAASTIYDWLPTASVRAKLPTREAYQRLLSIDMNKDGHLDIVAFQPPPSSMATADIFLGDGAFGFSAAIPVSLGFPVAATDFADVDGDGYPDLLLLGADTPYSTSDDDGQTLQIVFSARGSIPSLASISEVGTGTSALAAYDVNGDGIRDLAVLNYNPGELHTLLGNSAGEFDPASPSRIVQFKDMTGSIVADAMDLNPTTRMLAVLHTAPDPAKGADMVTLLDHDMAGSIFKERPTRITLRTAGAARLYNYTGLSVAKFEDTDLDDHVMLSRRTTMGGAGSLEAWFNKMMLWRLDMQARSTESADPNPIHLFPLDGMKRQAHAITLSETENKLSILAKIDNKPSRVYSTGPAPSAVASCHIDSEIDMRADLVVASADSDQVNVFLDPLNGGAPPRIDVPVCAQPRFVWCGDLNGDTYNDLLVGCSGHGSPETPTLEVLYGGGNRSFYRGSDAAPRPGKGGPIAVMQDAVAGLRIVAASHDGVLWTILPGR